VGNWEEYGEAWSWSIYNLLPSIILDGQKTMRNIRIAGFGAEVKTGSVPDETGTGYLSHTRDARYR